MTAKRALVLAGGGLAGIAWGTGILHGIADQSPETARMLLDCDVLVGPSAGSAVAAQLSSGLALDELYAGQVVPTSTELDRVSVSRPSPSFSTTRSQSGAQPGRSCRDWGDRGGAFAVFADEDSLAAFGANPLDPRCRVASAKAGRAQGRREAAALPRS